MLFEYEIPTKSILDMSMYTSILQMYIKYLCTFINVLTFKIEYNFGNNIC